MNHGLREVTVERIRAVLAQFPEVEKAVLLARVPSRPIALVQT
jgi:hypothetical protein